MKLICLRLEEGEQIYTAYLKQDFPPSELKPWAMMAEAVRQGQYDLLAAYENGVMVGYAWQFRPASGAILIDYLAVLPPYRGRGVGIALLDALRRYYANTGRGLLLESEYPPEAPDPAAAQRRLRFYHRAGLTDTGVQILLFGVRYCILSLSPVDDPAAEMTHLYRTMLSPDRFAQFVTVIP